MTLQTEMKAAIADAIGSPIRLASVSCPRPGLGEVLVRIHASGVNPLDLKIHAGTAAHARQPLPAILGLDLAGIVDLVGAGVNRFRRGDEVYGMTGGVGGHQGSLAQLAAVDADLLAIKPVNLSMRDDAGELSVAAERIRELQFAATMPLTSSGSCSRGPGGFPRCHGTGTSAPVRGAWARCNK